MFLDVRLWRLTAGVRGRIALAVAIGVLASTVGVARLALLGWLLGLVYRGEPLAALVWPGAAVALVMVLRGFLEHARAMVAHETAARVQLALRARLFDQVTALGPAHFGLARTGDALLAMVEGVEQLEIYFGQYLPQLFVAALTPLVVFALLAGFDLPLAALLLGFGWLTMIAPGAFQSWDRASSMRRRDAYKSFAAEFLDAIQGLATLKAFGQSAARGRLLAEKAHEVFRSTMWVLATNALTRGITDTGIALGAALTLAVGAWRVQAGSTSIETLLMVLMAGVEVFRPQRDLRGLLHDGMVALSAAQGIFELLEARPAVRWGEASPRERRGDPGAAADGASVAFEDVAFAYPGGRGAAHVGLDFRVAGGERVGFVGASGAGKSTIVKLALRLHDPDSGTVRLGGVDVRALDPESLYAQVAVVTQDTYLFHGTVEENLRFGRPGASAAELEEAARLANAHEFIDRLPQGYRTVIGERGVRLSGGQRQRIAIARALLRDAPVLVLDEALSAVDAENEAVIQQALDRLMRGRTTMVFAHRLSSVIDCDRILVLDAGRVVEEGTHATLMAAGGIYRTLMAGQAGQAGHGGAPAAALGERVRDAAAPRVERQDDDAVEDPESGIVEASDLSWGGVFRELGRYVRPWSGRLTVTFVLGVARVLAFIGVGVLSALAVAAVKRGEPPDAWLWALLVVAPAAGVLHWLESWAAHDMAFRMLSEMRVALYRQLDRLAPAFLTRRRSGDLVAMATHDVELVEYFYAHTVAPAFVAVLVPSVVLGVLAAHGWQLAAVLAPFLALVGASPFMLRGRIDALGSQARESLAVLNAHVVDSVQGLHEIIAFRQVAARREQFLARARDHLAIRLPFLRDLAWQNAALEVATGLGGLAVVVAGASLVEAGSLAPALLPLLTLLALAAFMPVAEIAHVSRQLADTLGAVRRLHAVQSEPVPVTDGPGVTAPDDDAPALALEDVRFAYPGRRVNALDGTTLAVPAGHTVALVGPSGAGKTTIAHLVLRFWDPDAGRVRLRGHDLREFALEDLRAQIALVSQDTYLFHDSLGANIRMARPEASDAQIAEAVRLAALEDFVASLPEGLDTPVGERGLRLSGGQRQRVAIARAFLKDAPILVLDEATSHLDAVSEAAVHGALETLMAHRTTIVIAHRLSTVRGADAIVVLEHGRVVETGTHDALLERGGLYRHLVARQLAAAAA